MVGRRLTDERKPTGAADPLGQHGNCDCDGQHSRCDEQGLLEPDPASMLAVAFEQELHGCPLSTSMPHEVDQVDQQREQDQQKTPRQRLK